MNEFKIDPLQGIGSPMTKLKAKRMKQTLHGALVGLQEDGSTQAKNTPSRLFVCLSVEDKAVGSSLPSTYDPSSSRTYDGIK